MDICIFIYTYRYLRTHMHTWGRVTQTNKEAFGRASTYKRIISSHGRGSLELVCVYISIVQVGMSYIQKGESQLTVKLNRSKKIEFFCERIFREAICVIAKRIPRVCRVNKFTLFSLGYSLSVFNKNSTFKGRDEEETTSGWETHYVKRSEPGTPRARSFYGFFFFRTACAVLGAEESFVCICQMSQTG